MLKAIKILKDLKNSLIRNEGNLNLVVDYSYVKNIKKAIKELKALEIEDRLAELEKVILDYYLDKGYQIGVGGWQFSIDINTYYKLKYLNVNFRESSDTFFFRVVKIESKTTKEMFDKAIEYFTIK